MAHDDPRSFRHILALTFTNKAAWEMKERILSDLAKLGSGKASEDFVQELSDQTRLDAKTLAKRARALRATMLHRYGELSVMTLDSFTNRLVKSFARDLALDQDYRIELDQDRLVDEAVGNVLDRIGGEGEEELTELLKGFARLQVEEEKDSRIRHPLTTYGKEVLKESMRNTLEALGDMSPEDFRALSQRIRKDVKAEERELESRVKVALAEVTKEGLTKKDVSRGSLLTWLEKNKRGEALAPTPTLQGMFDDSVFTTKTAPQSTVDAVERVRPHAEHVLEQVMHMVPAPPEVRPMFCASDCFTRWTWWAPLPSSLRRWKPVRRCATCGPFTLCTTAWPRSSDTIPFLFCLSGWAADTGTCLSMSFRTPLSRSGRTSFRSSITCLPSATERSWWAMASRPFTVGATATIVSCFICQTSLTTTKARLQMPRPRSTRPWTTKFSRTIGGVETRLWIGTTAFLTRCNRDCRLAFKTCTRTIAKMPRKEFEGQVCVEAIHDQDKDARKELLNDALIRRLRHHKSAAGGGFAWADMAVLVRTNKQGALLAQHMLNEGITPQTEDSLHVGRHPAALAVIALTRWVVDPNEERHATAWLQCMAALEPDRIDESKELDLAVTWTLGEDEKPRRRFAAAEMMRRICPDLNVAERAHGPLVSWVGHACEVLGVTGRFDAYAEALMELAREVTGTEEGGLRGFLRSWDRKGHARSIVAGGGHNAVQVMTVHKAKGLAFPVTIMVVGDNKAREVKGHVPVVLDPAVGMDLPAALLKVSDMKDTALNDVAEAELDAALLDQLNIVYVAMTRPIERLDVLAETAKMEFDRNEPTTVSQWVLACAEDTSGKAFVSNGDAIVHGANDRRSIPRLKNAHFDGGGDDASPAR